MIPAGEDQYSRMAAKRAGEKLGTLVTQVDAVALDRRRRRLRNAAQFGKLILAESLGLAHDSYRFADRNVCTLLRWTEVLQADLMRFRLS